MMSQLALLLTEFREWAGDLPPITEVFLAALGTDGKDGFQCELGFGDTTTASFQADTLEAAVFLAFRHANERLRRNP